MEIAIGAVTIVTLGVMIGLPLRADMSERFSIAWQTQNQKTCIRLYNVTARERILQRWVTALFASAAVLVLCTALSIVSFLTEDAKGYGNADETTLLLSFFGMTIVPLLALAAIYHTIGMVVRLRAWRSVLADTPIE